jgi:hypothetical protein
LIAAASRFFKVVLKQARREKLEGMSSAAQTERGLEFRTRLPDELIRSDGLDRLE